MLSRLRPYGVGILDGDPVWHTKCSRVQCSVWCDMIGIDRSPCVLARGAAEGSGSSPQGHECHPLDTQAQECAQHYKPCARRAAGGDSRGNRKASSPRESMQQHLLCVPLAALASSSRVARGADVRSGHNGAPALNASSLRRPSGLLARRRIIGNTIAHALALLILLVGLLLAPLLLL